MILSTRLHCHIGLFAVLLGALTGGSVFESETAKLSGDVGSSGRNLRLLMLLATAALAIAVLANLHLAKNIISLIGWPLGFLCVWILISLSWSSNPSIVLIRALQLTSAIILIFGFVSLLDDAYEALANLVLACLALTVLNWGGILFLPDLSVQKLVHQGAWTGLHIHKNVAGRAMGAATIVLLFSSIFLEKRQLTTGLLALCGAYFVYATSSKMAWAATKLSTLTSLTAYVLLGHLKPERRLKTIIIASSFAVAFTITAVGLGAFEFSLELAGVDPTLTGRTELWSLLLELLKLSPFVGHGYGSIWNVPGGPIETYGYSWFRQVYQGHNGYLDGAVAIGVPATIALILLVVTNLVNLLTSSVTAYPVYLITALTLFILLFNLTESGFFDRWRDLSTLLIFTLAVSKLLLRQEKAEAVHE